MSGEFSSKTREALQKPLHERCDEIEKLIDGSSAQNLHGFFPQLLSNIFGYSGSTDWGLKNLSRDSREFTAVRRFLSPDGAVFKLINLLQADDQHRYEFFISCLPFPTQNSLSGGIVPVMYQNKLPIHGPGEAVNSVLLNTFEYYMFHFAYYIVDQQTNWDSNVNSSQDFLYLIVLDEYLNFFLPSDGLTTLSNSIKGGGTVGSLRKVPSSWHDLGHYSRTQYFQNQFKGLIKPSSGRVSPPTVHHGMFDHGSQEIWRSETFLQILIEFWLNQNTTPSISSNVLSHGKRVFLDRIRLDS
ncbi:sphingomyelin phosphodiesterase 4-like [Acropora muricata]|uniref:sphingomyelin phosphodiesterase 4-like n=1 Tax=Acropora muricata TaxID=159855 RepID=UPI0034E48468